MHCVSKHSVTIVPPNRGRENGIQLSVFFLKPFTFVVLLDMCS